MLVTTVVVSTTCAPAIDAKARTAPRPVARNRNTLFIWLSLLSDGTRYAKRFSRADHAGEPQQLADLGLVREQVGPHGQADRKTDVNRLRTIRERMQHADVELHAVH